MSHDIVADALNKIMNAHRARKTLVTVTHSSKLLLSVLALAKLRGYIKSYTVEGATVTVEIHKLNGCGAIKPRSVLSVDQIDTAVARFLPAREIGILIISTSQGLMAHQTAQEKNIGGSLLAYFY